jgi:hypothetical protein
MVLSTYAQWIVDANAPQAPWVLLIDDDPIMVW